MPEDQTDAARILQRIETIQKEIESLQRQQRDCLQVLLHTPTDDLPFAELVGCFGEYVPRSQAPN